MPIITGRSPSGDVVDVAVDEDGVVKVLPSDTLDSYKLTDIDTTTTTEYYGYTDKSGNWYIMQLTGTTARYIKGSEDYMDNWSNKSILSYDYFYNIF